MNLPNDMNMGEGILQAIHTFIEAEFGEGSHPKRYHVCCLHKRKIPVATSANIGERSKYGVSMSSICAELAVIMKLVNGTYRRDVVRIAYNRRPRMSSSRVKKLRKPFRGVHATVVRVKADGTLSMSHPCDTCTRLMLFLGLTRVAYTNWNGDLVYVDLNESPIVYVRSGEAVLRRRQ